MLVYQRVTNTLIMKRWVLTLKSLRDRNHWYYMILYIHTYIHIYIYNSDYIRDASDRKSPICINGGGYQMGHICLNGDWIPKKYGGTTNIPVGFVSKWGMYPQWQVQRKRRLTFINHGEHFHELKPWLRSDYSLHLAPWKRIYRWATWGFRRLINLRVSKRVIWFWFWKYPLVI